MTISALSTSSPVLAAWPSTAVRPGAEPDDLDALAEQYSRDRQACPDDAGRALLRERMIRTTAPFAKRLARRFRRNAELRDLEQVAQIGLIKAVDRYEADRGSFTAYAYTTILGELKRHLRDSSWVLHTPRRMQELTLQVVKQSAALAERLGRAPSDPELARACDLPLDRIAEARRCATGYHVQSLNRPVNDDESAELGDLQGAPDPGIDQVTDRITAAGLIRRLPGRERRILTMRFTEDRTQAEIAAELGLSQMHVSRLLTRTLTWLRAAMLSDEVPPWPADTRPDSDGRAEVTMAGLVREVQAVRIVGEVDRDNAADIRGALFAVIRRQPEGRTVHLDLSRLPFLDAAGIAVLLAVHEAARGRGVAVTAGGLPAYLRKAVTVAGLGALLTT